MTIACNALSARAGAGISAFVNLLPYFSAIAPNDRFFIFLSSDQDEIIAASQATIQTCIFRHVPRNPFLRVIWEQLVLPWVLLRLRVNLLYSVGNTSILLAPCRILLFIENSNPYSRLAIAWPLRERLRNFMLRVLAFWSAQRATTIRFASHQSMEIMRRELHVPNHKCIVIYHGVRPASSDNSLPAGLAPGYILNVSVVAPHKNLEVLIAAQEHAHRIGEITPLIVVGDRCYPEYDALLQDRIIATGLANTVRFLGRISHAQIHNYYHHAALFVMTSVEETFGIPVLEAMGNGVPVLAPRHPTRDPRTFFLPFEEVCGGAAEYYNPFDADELATKITSLLKDSARRQELSRRGRERAEQFTWERSARELIAQFHMFN